MNWTWLLPVVPASLAANQLTVFVRRRWMHSDDLRRTARATLIVAALACFGAAFFNVVPLVMNGAAIVALAIAAALRETRTRAELRPAENAH